MMRDDRGREIRNEGDILKWVWETAKQRGYDIFRAEKMRIGSPDILIETDRGMVLIELKFAVSGSKKLFSEIQKNTMSRLNVRKGIVRAVGLTAFSVGGLEAFIVDYDKFPLIASDYAMDVVSEGGRGIVIFNTIREVFDHIVHTF